MLLTSIKGNHMIEIEDEDNEEEGEFEEVMAPNVIICFVPHSLLPN